MKIKDIKLLSLLSALLLTLVSCETDFDNPNSATNEQTFSSREGILAASVGMQQLYSTTGVRYLIETPAITTREGGITTTFQNMIELEDGGSVLPDFNSNVQGLWATMLRVMKIAEDIEANVVNVDLAAGTEAGLLAHAKLFKAMAIGGLAQNYEQVIVQTSNDNDAAFVSRIEALNTAITLLSEAQTILASTAISAEFENAVTLGNINIENTISAFLARYNLFAGNYDAAITSAEAVDLSSVSNFVYDLQNLNPIWERVFLNDSPNFKPRDNFGLPSEFVFEETDGRLAFYLVTLDENNQNGLPIEDLAGFFNVNVGSIPLYIPDEMNLIVAEAQVRKSSTDLVAAETALNEVLTDTDDPLEINASASPYAGELSATGLLNAIYQNRRAELFLTGLSLEDSRRFERPEPSGSAMQFAEERNRNFYPYPDTERNSNPNTPENPNL